MNLWPSHWWLILSILIDYFYKMHAYNDIQKARKELTLSVTFTLTLPQSMMFVRLSLDHLEFFI